MNALLRRFQIGARPPTGSALRSWAMLALLGVPCGFTGCASTPKGPPQPYIRIARPTDDTVQLQIATRKFSPAHGHGPVIWLVGASHIGESNYYAGLQQQLDAYTLVLYEGVGEHARRTRPTPSRAKPARPPGARPLQATNNGAAEASAGLQDTMARSLGLVFQLEAIDYDRTNFLNSDLTITEIQSLMQSGVRPDRAKPPATPPLRKISNAADEDNTAFRDLLKAMDGSSAFGALMQGLMKFIGTSPKLQAMTKLTLIEVLGAIRADPTRLQGMPPDMKRLLEVLIRERNKVVIEDLKLQLKHARRTESIGVFYGAGHLPDLEYRLARDLHYRPKEDVWHAAFSVNTTRAGLSEFELGFLRSFIRSQIGPLTK